jgi:hypothetical protein
VLADQELSEFSNRYRGVFRWNEFVIENSLTSALISAAISEAQTKQIIEKRLVI